MARNPKPAVFPVVNSYGITPPAVRRMMFRVWAIAVAVVLSACATTPPIPRRPDSTAADVCCSRQEQRADYCRSYASSGELVPRKIDDGSSTGGSSEQTSSCGVSYARLVPVSGQGSQGAAIAVGACLISALMNRFVHSRAHDQYYGLYPRCTNAQFPQPRTGNEVH